MDKIKFIIVALVAILVIGCTAMGHKTAAKNDPNGEWVSRKETATRGQQNINKLDLGMSKEQVQEIMTTKNHYHAGAHRRPTIISHPYKRELMEVESKHYEILYYYTKYAKRDAALTPVIFLDGKVIGIGWHSFRKLQQ